MADDASESAVSGLSIGLFGVIVVLIGWDVAGDYAAGAHWTHLLPELFVLLGATGGMAFLLKHHFAVRSRLGRVSADLVEARAEAERWRAESHELIAGLGAAIEQQFARWKLSNAEAEIGLLLLKGLSHKELAQLRHTSERTVREQARSLYRKAGLGGRSALAAFFLEDLLLPQQHRQEPAR